MPSDDGLTRKQWEEKLGQIAQNLRLPTQLTLMGSAPNILAGQPSRTSMDLDVWNPTSDFDRSDLQNAVEKAGLLFDPKEAIDPTTPYIQIVEPGICQLGEFKPQKIEKRGNLHLEKPPAATLIAAKLLRAQDKDLEDIAWLLSTHQISHDAVRDVILTFPAPQRQTALENLVYLAALSHHTRATTETSPKKRPLAPRSRAKKTNPTNLEGPPPL